MFKLDVYFQRQLKGRRPGTLRPTHGVEGEWTSGARLREGGQHGGRKSQEGRGHQQPPRGSSLQLYGEEEVRREHRVAQAQKGVSGKMNRSVLFATNYIRSLAFLLLIVVRCIVCIDLPAEAARLRAHKEGQEREDTRVGQAAQRAQAARREEASGREKARQREAEHRSQCQLDPSVSGQRRRGGAQARRVHGEDGRF